MTIRFSRWAALIGTAFLAAMLTTACSGDQTNDETGTLSRPEPERTGQVPLVTLSHWKDSTAGERYAFLIGFVTMLELEKEWQGHGGRELLPFGESLIKSWVAGFADRPLTEIYNGINAFISAHPGDLERPVAEVMWFTFIQPRLDEAESVTTPSERPEAPHTDGQAVDKTTN